MGFETKADCRSLGLGGGGEMLSVFLQTFLLMSGISCTGEMLSMFAQSFLGISRHCCSSINKQFQLFVTNLSQFWLRENAVRFPPRFFFEKDFMHRGDMLSIFAQELSGIFQEKL